MVCIKILENKFNLLWLTLCGKIILFRLIHLKGVFFLGKTNMVCEKEKVPLEERVYKILSACKPEELRKEAQSLMDATKGRLPEDLDMRREIFGQLGELR